VGSAKSAKNCSQHGCSGQSFKSVKSYVLGDLDISSQDGEDETLSNSFEISSNTTKSIKSFKTPSSDNKVSPVKKNSVKTF